MNFGSGSAYDNSAEFRIKRAIEADLFAFGVQVLVEFQGGRDHLRFTVLEFDGTPLSRPYFVARAFAEERPDKVSASIASDWREQYHPGALLKREAQ